MKQIIRVSRSLFIGLLSLFLVSSIALALVYSATINISNTSATSYTMFPARTPLSTTDMITSGVINTATGLDTLVESGGTAIPHMLADDKLLFAAPSAAGSSNALTFSSGNAAIADFDIITGYNGYFYKTDDADMELSSNFTIEWDGYVDTAAGTNKNLVSKAEAFKTYVSAASEITSAIYTPAIFRPSAAGTVTGLTPLGSANNFENVDEAVANDVDYNYRAAAGSAYDLYALANSTQTGVIEKVTISVRGQISGAGAVYRSRIRTHATNYDSADLTDGAWATNTIDYTTNPNTGTTWTWTEIDDLEIGCYASSDGVGSNGYISQLFITVYYWLPVSATGIASGEKTVTVRGTANYPQWATGNVLTYDGNDELRNATANWRSTDNTGTIFAWYKRTSVASMVLLSSCDEGSNVRIFSFGFSGNQLVMSQNNNDTENGVLTGVIANNADGNWHSVAATSNGTLWRIYFDGVEKTVTPYAGTNNGDWLADTDLRDSVVFGYLGRSAKTLYWNGTIADTLYYSDAKTPAEILAMHNDYRNPTNLVAAWLADEGTGNVSDYVGSYTMTVTGATWTTSTYTSGGTGRPCDYTIQVDSSRWGANLKGVSVPNNANTWYFAQGNVSPYLDYYKHYVGGALIAWYQPVSYIVGTALPDRQGVAEDAVIVWGTNPLGIVITMGGMVVDTTAAAIIGAAPPDAAGEVNLPPAFFPEESELADTGFWHDIFTPIASDTNTPLAFFYIFASVVIVLSAMVITMKYTQNLALSGFSVLVAIAGCIGMTLLPPVIIFLIAVGVLFPLTMERSQGI